MGTLVHLLFILGWVSFNTVLHRTIYWTISINLEGKTEVTWTLGHCPHPASPSRPPGRFQRHATGEWLSWYGAAELLACHSRQSGAVPEGSRIEKFAQ